MSKTIRNDWWEKKRKEIKEEIRKTYKINTEEVTDIRKITLNSGVGKYAKKDIKNLEKTKECMSLIAFNRKPKVTKAKKSIKNFGVLREGESIGLMITLRRKEIWNFLFEMINISFPSIPNFRGFSKNKFDKTGNYTFGINNLDIFKSIDYNLTFQNQGLQISIDFSSSSKEQNELFLKLLKFPFAKE